MQKVILLVESPFSKRDYDRMGVEALQRSFEVVVLDCTPWIKPEFWKKYSEVICDFNGYITIHKRLEIKNYLEKYSGSIIIDYLGVSLKALWIRYLSKKNKNKLTKVLCVQLPSVSTELKGKISRIIKEQSIKKVFRSILLKLIGKVDLSPDIVILGGEAGLGTKSVLKANHVIPAHSFDYDIFLSISDKNIEKDYAVFLDEDMVYHSDYLHLGLKPPATEKDYYFALNSFFDWFENQFKFKVIIAAHPRSRYDLRPNLFAGRDVILGKTAELVRDCKLVFSHASTSKSFVVLWSKPIIFLTTNELEKSWIKSYIHNHAGLFEKEPINIDNLNYKEFTINELFYINKEVYRNYRRLYLQIPNSQEKPVWEIFSEYIKINNL